MPKKTIIHLSILAIAIGSIFIVNGLIFAWSPPSQAPTGGNVPAPINAGGSQQLKSGDLLIGGIFEAYQRAIFDERIQIKGGSPGVGKVLTSDATGLASWQEVSGGGEGGSLVCTARSAQWTGLHTGNSLCAGYGEICVDAFGTSIDDPTNLKAVTCSTNFEVGEALCCKGGGSETTGGTTVGALDMEIVCSGGPCRSVQHIWGAIRCTNVNPVCDKGTLRLINTIYTNNYCGFPIESEREIYQSYICVE